MEDKPFKAGDIVKCNYDFFEERQYYPHHYPKKGQYLTVSHCLQMIEDPNCFMLLFDDLKIQIPLAAERFDMVQTERDGDAILNDAYKIANNL